MPATRTKGGFYGVRKGKTNGVYTSWEECEAQVKGYPGAIYKKFATRDAAEIFVYGALKRDITQPRTSSSQRRFEQICAALSSLPSSQPQATPPTPSFRSSQGSQKRFEEILAALSSSPPPPESSPVPSLSQQLSTAPSSQLSEPELTPSTPNPDADHLRYKSPSRAPQVSRPDVNIIDLTDDSVFASPVSAPSRRQAAPPRPIHKRKVRAPTPTPTPEFVDDGPISQFFSQYSSSFTYKPENAPTSEFNRLCRTLYLEPGTKDKKQAYDAFAAALTDQFSLIFGTNINSITSWQALCARIGISPLPETVNKCRKVVRATHVNLVDLTTPSCVVKIFDSEKELGEYSRDSDKIFPRHKAKAGTLLYYLLRRIFS